LKPEFGRPALSGKDSGLEPLVSQSSSVDPPRALTDLRRVLRSSLNSSALVRAMDVLLRPPVLLLLVATFIISRGIAHGELHYYTDETRHAFTGVFFRDFLVDLPLRHPVQYAFEYYAKYPAIATPHWPPIFHMVEAVGFLIFGISAWVSRLAVLCFALVGVYYWYRIVEMDGSRYRAFLAAVIFACTPYVLLYERAAMLEVPWAALCLGAIYYWLRMMRSENADEVWKVAAFAAAAFLTSQTAIFLVFFFGLHFLLERPYGLLRKWQVWVALLAVVAAVLPWYLLASRTLMVWSSRATGRSFGYLTTKIHLLFYLNYLPQQLGWLLLCLSVAGAMLAVFTQPRRWRFFLLWLASCYLCFTLVYEKDPRHTFIWIPPFVYFALWAVEVLSGRGRLAKVLCTGLAAFFVINALRLDRPKIVGLEEVAQYVLSSPESEIVYYQGELNGDFIFHVRKFDPERRHMVAREKQVVLSQLGRDGRRILSTPQDILNFFRTWRIRYAVVEDHDFLPELESVRKVFHSDSFQLIRTFVLWSNDSKLHERKVFVYRYGGEFAPTREPVTIPMMTLRTSIKVDLQRLAGPPWPN
jgi:hypothetical protein